VSEVKELVQAGYQEIILTGVQISVYEHSGDKVHGLCDLVAAILGETSVPRLRLTSIAPWDLDESLLDLWRDPRLCRHLHLSLQSGADPTLRRMRRAYTAAQFARAADRARERVPDVGITTDVIVGFPGESDAEFEASLRFVEEMKFSRVHVFPYSAREGTVAASLPLQVPDAVKDLRRKQMQVVANASARAFAERFIGRTMEVLWETSSRDRRPATDAVRSHPSRWSGYTDNYIRVTTASYADLHNRIMQAELVTLEQDEVEGRLAQEEVQVSLV
jgi:threonylcarbamoyladenosine tRNA methylthiotransferase MtaB